MSNTAYVVEHVERVLALLTIILGPLPLARAAARAGRRDLRPPAHDVLVTVIAWCVLQIAVTLALGAWGFLDLRGVLAAQVALAAVGVGWRGRAHPASGSSGGSKPDGERMAERALLGAIAVMGLALLVKLASTPITEHDSLGYHLSAVALWYQEHGFASLEGFHYGRYYPFGWEALATLFVIPFGEDVLVTLPNLAAWGLLGLSVSLIAVDLGARRVMAITAATLALGVPLVWKQVTTMHVDLALAAFFLAGLHLVLDYGARREPTTLGVLVAALGLMAGVKTSGLIYATMLVLVLCAFTAVRPRAPRRLVPGPSAMPVLLVALAGVWVGLFWYTRNALHVGNPLGDVQVAIGPIVLVPGTRTTASIASTTLLHCFDPGRPSHWGILWERAAALLGVSGLAILGLAAIGLSTWSGSRPTAARAAVAALVPATALAYWATPYGADNRPCQGEITPWIGEGFRYALPLLGIAAALAGLAGARLGRWTTATAIAAGTIVLARTWTSTTTIVTIAVAGAAVAWRLVGRVDRRSPAAGRVAGAAAVSLLVLAVLGASLRLRGQRDRERVRTYENVDAVLAATARAGEAIGCAGGAPCYVLHGRTLERKVVHVPWAGGDRARWIAELDRHAIRLLAVGRLRAGDHRTAWLHDAGFAPVWRRTAAPTVTLHARGLVGEP